MGKGKIVDMSGSQNFSVEVALTGQLFTWRRHIDQLKCYEEATPEQPPETSAVSEGKEEEDTSSITEVWLDPNQPEASEQPSSDVSVNPPRRNPPRNRKPPDRLTY